MATEKEGPNYIMAFLMILIIIFIFGKNYVYKNTAIKLSKDPKNIIEGCLFLEKKYSKANGTPMFDVNIDGKVYTTMYTMVYDFPIINKISNFENNLSKDVSCYKVKYIKVKILFIEKRYLYDLVE